MTLSFIVFGVSVVSLFGVVIYSHRQGGDMMNKRKKVNIAPELRTLREVQETVATPVSAKKEEIAA